MGTMRIGRCGGRHRRHVHWLIKEHGSAGLQGGLEAGPVRRRIIPFLSGLDVHTRPCLARGVVVPVVLGSVLTGCCHLRVKHVLKRVGMRWQLDVQCFAVQAAEIAVERLWWADLDTGGNRFPSLAERLSWACHLEVVDINHEQEAELIMKEH